MTRIQGPGPDTETAAARRNAPGEGFVIGLSGGSASGKSTLAAELAKRLEAFQPVVLNQDRYFHDWSELPPEEREARMTANHPDAVRWQPLVEHVARLRNGEAVDARVPGTRSARQGTGQIVLGPTRLLIVEGHLIFGEPALRALFDLKLFLDVPPDERILRRMYREAVERGGDLARAIAWYRRDVLPNYRLHTEPTRQFADLILPWTEAREPIIDLIAAGVRAQLETSGEPQRHKEHKGHEVETEEGHEVIP